MPARIAVPARYAVCSGVGLAVATCGLDLGGSSRLLHTVGMIRLGTPADLAAATSVYRRANNLGEATRRAAWDPGPG